MTQRPTTLKRPVVVRATSVNNLDPMKASSTKAEGLEQNKRVIYEAVCKGCSPCQGHTYRCDCCLGHGGWRFEGGGGGEGGGEGSVRLSLTHEASPWFARNVQSRVVEGLRLCGRGSNPWSATLVGWA